MSLILYLVLSKFINLIIYYILVPKNMLIIFVKSHFACNVGLMYSFLNLFIFH